MENPNKELLLKYLHGSGEPVNWDDPVIAGRYAQFQFAMRSLAGKTIKMRCCYEQDWLKRERDFRGKVRLMNRDGFIDPQGSVIAFFRNNATRSYFTLDGGRSMGFSAVLVPLEIQIIGGVNNGNNEASEAQKVV